MEKSGRLLQEKVDFLAIYSGNRVSNQLFTRMRVHDKDLTQEKSHYEGQSRRKKGHSNVALYS